MEEWVTFFRILSWRKVRFSLRVTTLASMKEGRRVVVGQAMAEEGIIFILKQSRWPLTKELLPTIAGDTRAVAAIVDGAEATSEEEEWDILLCSPSLSLLSLSCNVTREDETRPYLLIHPPLPDSSIYAPQSVTGFNGNGIPAPYRQFRVISFPSRASSSSTYIYSPKMKDERAERDCDLQSLICVSSLPPTSQVCFSSSLSRR